MLAALRDVLKRAKHLKRPREAGLETPHQRGHERAVKAEGNSSSGFVQCGPGGKGLGEMIMFVMDYDNLLAGCRTAPASLR